MTYCNNSYLLLVAQGRAIIGEGALIGTRHVFVGGGESWKWEKLDKIREAVGLVGPLKLLTLSLPSTFVGGGDGKRGII